MVTVVTVVTVSSNRGDYRIIESSADINNEGKKGVMSQFSHKQLQYLPRYSDDAIISLNIARLSVIKVTSMQHTAQPPLQQPPSNTLKLLNLGWSAIRKSAASVELAFVGVAAQTPLISGTQSSDLQAARLSL